MDVLLYAPENPRNLGNIVRTTSCFNIPRILIYDKHELLTKPEAIAGMGETAGKHKVEIVTIQDPTALFPDYERRYATTLAGCSVRLGDPNYYSTNVLPLDSLIMFGGETEGLPRALVRHKDVTKIQIPTEGMDSCLSLPVAYGIVLFYFLLQHPELLPERGGPPTPRS